jgi:hypothetical protein
MYLVQRRVRIDGYFIAHTHTRRSPIYLVQGRIIVGFQQWRALRAVRCIDAVALVLHKVGFFLGRHHHAVCVFVCMCVCACACV